MKPKRIFALSALLLTIGCRHHQWASSGKSAGGPRVASVETKASQEAMTPELALARLKDGNARFMGGKEMSRDHLAQVHATSEGQYPFASFVSCVDSRVPAEIIFDLSLGDAFNIRLAGNIVDDDVLGSLEFATKVAGSKLIVVLGHTHCGAIKGAIDQVELGNLSGLLRRITPAVDATQGVSGERSSKNLVLVDEVAKTNVRLSIAAIREKSPLVRELEASNAIKIVGALYHLDDGSVEFLE